MSAMTPTRFLAYGLLTALLIFGFLSACQTASEHMKAYVEAQ